MHHHVYSLDSTVFCKENGIPATAKTLSECSSCLGRCGDILNKTNNKPCSCDVLCMVHGDCCGDFKQFCPEDYTTAQTIAKHYGGLKSTCVDVNDVPFARRPTPTHAAMITTCSNDSAPCNFNFMDAHSILTHGGAVLDSLHGVTFVNAKCAVCNGIPLWRLRPLEVLLICDPSPSPVLALNYLMQLLNSNQSFSLENNPWYIKEDYIGESLPLDPKNIVREVLSSSKCNLGFRLENSKRQCVKQIDTCPETCNNTELVDLCFTAPQALVTAVGNGIIVTYRNIYCGLCNHGHDIGFKCGFTGSLGVIPNGLLSLSLLFDMNRNRGAVLQSIKAKCKKKDQRIPGGIRCGQVVCPVGYSHTGQGCSKEQVEFITNVTSMFHISIEAPTNCSENNNTDILIDKLHTAFISALDGKLNTSKSKIRIEMSHSCLLTSNYTLEVFVSTRSHEDRSQNISVLLRNVGVVTVWNIFQGIFVATNMSGNTIWITSGSVTLSNENIKQAQCDGVFQITDTSSFQNILSQEGNISFNPNKRRVDALNPYAPLCTKYENQNTMTKVSEGLGYITIGLSTLSLFCLTLRLILQAFYKPYHTSPGKMQFQLSLALVFANVLLLTSPLAVNIPSLCAILGALKHACFIASFCWMTCISIDVWRVFRPTNIMVSNNDPIVKISIVTWVLPMVFSSTVFALDYIDIEFPISPRLGGSICWFTNRVSLLTFFVVPVAVIIIINAIFFALVWRSLNASLNSTLKDKTVLSGRQYSVYLRMFLLMGLTWSTLLVAVLIDWDAIWYIFVVCNASQGCYMFLAFGPEKQWWMSLLDGIAEFRSPKSRVSGTWLIIAGGCTKCMKKRTHEGINYTTWPVRKLC